jgi:hypothetical protein
MVRQASQTAGQWPLVSLQAEAIAGMVVACYEDQLQAHCDTTHVKQTSHSHLARLYRQYPSVTSKSIPVAAQPMMPS